MRESRDNIAKSIIEIITKKMNSCRKANFNWGLKWCDLHKVNL